jgi:hypothetical protein
MHFPRRRPNAQWDYFSPASDCVARLAEVSGCPANHAACHPLFFDVCFDVRSAGPAAAGRGLLLRRLDPKVASLPHRKRLRRRGHGSRPRTKTADKRPLYPAGRTKLPAGFSFCSWSPAHRSGTGCSTRRTKAEDVCQKKSPPRRGGLRSNGGAGNCTRVSTS